MAGIEESFESLGGMLDSDDVRTGFISGHCFKRKAVQYAAVDGMAVFEGCIVLGTVEQLPEIHRMVVLLHSIEGLTLRETAGVLEIPPGTAKSRLNAALKMLRRTLREWKGGVG